MKGKSSDALTQLDAQKTYSEIEDNRNAHRNHRLDGKESRLGWAVIAVLLGNGIVLGALLGNAFGAAVGVSAAVVLPAFGWLWIAASQESLNEFCDCEEQDKSPGQAILCRCSKAPQP